jgi:hypothetical protein
MVLPELQRIFPCHRIHDAPEPESVERNRSAHGGKEPTARRSHADDPTRAHRRYRRLYQLPVSTRSAGMSDETILDLFDDVCDILQSLQCELSCITTSDTGSDPTVHIRRGIDDLRKKIADKRTSDPNQHPASIQHKKESS